jgi:hypothetical protein
MNIDSTQLTSLGEHCRYTHAVEASELGLPPGSWPPVLECPILGNGLAFYPARVNADGSRLYRQDLGVVEILVLND